MIIVLNTNVVVSGILRPTGKAGLILTLVADGVLQVAYDPRLLSEYRDVLKRPKFALTRDYVETFLTHLEQEGVRVSAKPLKMHLPDPGDKPFLEVAIAGKATAIVSGYKRLYPRREYKGVKLLSPTEFLEVLEERI